MDKLLGPLPKAVIEDVHFNVVVPAQRITHSDERDGRHHMPFQFLQRHRSDAEQVAKDHVVSDQHHLGDADPGGDPADTVDESVDAAGKGDLLGPLVQRSPSRQTKQFRRQPDRQRAGTCREGDPRILVVHVEFSDQLGVQHTDQPGDRRQTEEQEPTRPHPVEASLDGQNEEKNEQEGVEEKPDGPVHGQDQVDGPAGQ